MSEITLVPHPPDVIEVDPEILDEMKRRLAGKSRCCSGGPPGPEHEDWCDLYVPF